MTGGAFGSLVAQHFHLTSAERKTLLVAGAAAGMSATFATPVAAVLLAVELLLFEWKPRSVIPVALASATAAIAASAAARRRPAVPGPAAPPHSSAAVVLGCVARRRSPPARCPALLTRGVYAAEDAFQRLPIHWMWWPAIGGLAIGLGGLIVSAGPRRRLRRHRVDCCRATSALHVVLGVLLVKSMIWVVALGSGTSGGVLAPLLMMGGALGGLEARVSAVRGRWLLGARQHGRDPRRDDAGAVHGGGLRAGADADDFGMLLPLLIAVTVAYAFTVLLLPRSILTEKVSRRGYHLSREYAIDPLEILFAREVMRTTVVALPSDTPIHRPRRFIADAERVQRLYPVVDADKSLRGVIARSEIRRLTATRTSRWARRRLVTQRTVVARPDEPLRLVAHRMAETGLTRFPVVDPRAAGATGRHDRPQRFTAGARHEPRRRAAPRAGPAAPHGPSASAALLPGVR